MPSPTTGADRTKVLSVRLTTEEFEALTARATEVGVGPSTLARTFVRQALGAGTTPAAASSSSFESPSQLSALEAHLEARIAADLVPRLEALERWVRDTTLHRTDTAPRPPEPQPMQPHTP